MTTETPNEYQTYVNCDYCNSKIIKYKSQVEKYNNFFCDEDCRDKWQSENWNGENNPHHIDAEKRFWSKVNKGKPNDCWEWNGYLNEVDSGYGELKYKGNDVKAHRFMLAIIEDEDIEVWQGDIDWDNLVLHDCDNRSCVNPEHLYVGSASDNINDAHERSIEEMPKGEKHKNSDLTKDDVLEIRRRWENESAKKIAEDFPVQSAQVHKVATGRSWSHV